MQTAEERRAYHRAWSAANRERVRSYGDKEQRRAYRHAYYLDHHEEALQNQRAYNRTHPDRVRVDRETHRVRAAALRARYPERHLARCALGYAVRSGRIVRGPCAACGNPITQGHHHAGYDRENWLVVTWLCAAHHGEAHWIDG
jgi:hypothetical protein